MNEQYKILITKYAYDQIIEISQYISNVLRAKEAANNLLVVLEKRIGELQTFPERYQLVSEQPWRSEGIRRMVVKKFYVYYWIDQKQKIVSVVAVIYERRNQIKQLVYIDKDI